MVLKRIRMKTFFVKLLHKTKMSNFILILAMREKLILNMEIGLLCLVADIGREIVLR